MNKGQLRIAVVVILGLVALGFLGFMVSKVEPLMLASVLDDMCDRSIKMHALAGFLGVDDMKSKLHCPPKDTLDKSDIGSARGREEARYNIANSMARCGKLFNRGQYDLFTEEGIFCGICEWTEYKDKGETFGHYREFLATTPIPKKLQLAEGEPPLTTYADYLTKSSTPQFAEIFNDPDKFNKQDPLLASEIDTDKIYATNFVYLRGETALNSFKDYLGGQGKGALAMGAATTGVGVGIAVFVLAGPVAWVVGGVSIVVGAGVALWQYIANDPPETASFVTFGEYNEENFKKIDCKEMVAELG